MNNLERMIEDETRSSTLAFARKTILKSRPLDRDSPPSWPRGSFPRGSWLPFVTGRGGIRRGGRKKERGKVERRGGGQWRKTERDNHRTGIMSTMLLIVGSLWRHKSESSRYSVYLAPTMKDNRRRGVLGRPDVDQVHPRI